LDSSEFHVADTAELLVQDPVVLLYITIGLARRLDGANQALLELKNMLRAGESPGVIGATIDRIEGFLNSIGSGYLRAGAAYSMYPFA
jgi:hypothetical protein